MTDHEIAQQLNASDWRAEIKKKIVNVGEWLSIFIFSKLKKVRISEIEIKLFISNLFLFLSFVNDC